MDNMIWFLVSFKQQPSNDEPDDYGTDDTDLERQIFTSMSFYAILGLEGLELILLNP